MPLAVVPALVAGGLLALAGALKLLDPTMTVGAFRALGLPAGPLGIRFLAAVELGIGVGALTWTGALPWLLVGTSLVILLGLSLAALRARTPIGSCGCFGRADTPPHWTHAAVLAAVLASVPWAATLDRAPVDELADRPGAGVLAALAAAALLGLVFAVFTRGPSRPARGPLLRNAPATPRVEGRP